MYDTMQLPDSNAHMVELNAPPILPSPHDIVPVGILGKLEVSVIFTENDIDDPGCTVARFGVITLDVGSIVTTVTVLLMGVGVEVLLEFVFVFDCKVEVVEELVPDVDTLELEAVFEEDVFDELLLDTLPEDPCETVEFVTAGTVDVEFPESVEKAYCGKTSIATSEMMSRAFRSILLYIPNS
ncbi:protein of unknown function [Nitrosotalea devaniterrae]|uniref:Uncharacterized protein n=1 Tax=Nitrosotalea devaniterrae TaxID=1078905 RepID=A0A128A3R2_9ARCH|nr:protein of unknown function [Candidatus Nitrosotalea devanaterra]